MDWNDWKNDLANKLFMDATNADLELELPKWAVETELVMQRDLDIVDCRFADTTTQLVANSRLYTAPVVGTAPNLFPAFVVVEQFRVITPVGAVSATSVRNPLLPVSKEFLDEVAPSDQAPSVPSIPKYICPLGSGTYLLGPSADATYTMECYGPQRMTPLSPKTSVNFLSINYPDLYTAMSMTYAAAWKQSLGAAADNPQLALSWGAIYKELLGAVSKEEARKKYLESGWNPKPPPAPMMGGQPPAPARAA